MARSHCGSREASRNKVPPAVRKWAVDHGKQVREIRRFDEENEGTHRGWTIYCRHLDLSYIPDGFRFGNVFDLSNSNVFCVQVKEE